jgi:hypothetical protein
MNQLKQYLKVAQWFLKGKPVPPPHLIKQKAILRNANRYNTRIMVETGTLLGDMVEAMKNHFAQIYSIEISPELAQKAKRRFANDRHVQIIESDSAVALKGLLPGLHEPALFWLDGHYSGGNTGKGEKDTPIMAELATIYASDIPHVVLIDDARCFGTDKDYPSQNELASYIKTLRPSASILVKNDCIVVTP